MEKKNKEIAKVSVEINKKINELSQTRSDLNNQIKIDKFPIEYGKLIIHLMVDSLQQNYIW